MHGFFFLPCHTHMHATHALQACSLIGENSPLITGTMRVQCLPGLCMLCMCHVCMLSIHVQCGYDEMVDISDLGSDEHASWGFKSLYPYMCWHRQTHAHILCVHCTMQRMPVHGCVAQWESIRLLTYWLQVRILPHSWLLTRVLRDGVIGNSSGS